MEKILIIDDDKLVRKVFKMTLMKEGYDILEAEDWPTGLQLIRSERPDLTLTDYQMPGMNGIEVLAEIRKTKTNMPVIILTAFGDVVRLLRLYSLERLTFEKPVNPELLKTTIKNVLESVSRSNKLTGVIKKDIPVDNALEHSILVGKPRK